MGKSTLSGGNDTLSFDRVTGQVYVSSIPEWALAHGSTLGGCRSNNYAYSYSSDGVFNGINSLCYLSTPTATTPSGSYIETVSGGPSGNDNISTGGLVNTLKPGDGDGDFLRDYGGYPDPDGTGPISALAASSDTFKGFSETSGLDYMVDWAGTADKLDLRPFESSDVYVDRSGNDLIITFNGTSGVQVYDYFYSVTSSTGAVSYPRRIENIIFADGTVTPAKAQSMADASSSEMRDERDERVEAAKKLVDNAEAVKQRAEEQGHAE